MARINGKLSSISVTSKWPNLMNRMYVSQKQQMLMTWIKWQPANEYLAIFHCEKKKRRKETSSWSDERMKCERNALC